VRQLTIYRNLRGLSVVKQKQPRLGINRYITHLTPEFQANEKAHTLDNAVFVIMATHGQLLK
jgi:hypothetical protein